MKIYAFHLLNDFSGSPKVLSQLCKGWAAQGSDVTVVTCDGREGFLSGIAGVAYQHYWYRWHAHPWRRLAALCWSQISLMALMWSQVKRDDILFVNTLLPFGAALLGKLKGARVVYHIHETSMRPRPLRWFLQAVMRLCAQEAIMVSDHVAQCTPCGHVRTHVLHNAIPKSFLEIAQQRFTYRTSRKNVLMICSLKVYKGIDVFVNLAASRPQYAFRLVVNANEVEIAAYWEGQALPTNLLIFPVQADVHPFYRWADVVLNLSLPDQWVETFGLTALEAMAYRLPVIVPAVGGIAEVVQNGSQGFHADARAMPALQRKLDLILSDPEIYDAMAQAAKERVLQFGEAAFLSGCWSILQGTDQASHSRQQLPTAQPAGKLALENQSASGSRK